MLPVSSLQLRVASFESRFAKLLFIKNQCCWQQNQQFNQPQSMRRVACGDGVWHVVYGMCQAGIQAGSSVCSNRPTMSTKSPRHCGRCCCHAPITVAAHTHIHRHETDTPTWRTYASRQEGAGAGAGAGSWSARRHFRVV